MKNIIFYHTPDTKISVESFIERIKTLNHSKEYSFIAFDLNDFKERSAFVFFPMNDIAFEFIDQKESLIDFGFYYTEFSHISYINSKDYLPFFYLSLNLSIEDTLVSIDIMFKDMLNKENLKNLNNELELNIEKNNELLLKSEIAQKAQERFFNNISHEIRTPINGFNGVIHLLKETSLNEVQKEYIRMLEGSLENLQNVIYDLLDYSRIETGQLKTNNDVFDLQKNLLRLLKTFTYRAHKKGIEIIYEPQSRIPKSLIGDIDKISQIMINIISNAVKFTDSGEIKVEVFIEKEDSKSLLIHFIISDTGIGIDNELISNLFKPFSVLEDSKTKKYSGTGLGLALSKQLVEMMNGKIWCESIKNKGSKFHFTIPFETGNKEKQSLSQDECFKNKKVLIIDDSIGTRRLLKKIMDFHSISAELAATANDAKNCLSSIKNKNDYYDFILLDLHLPDMSGWELAELIIKDTYFKKTKIIVITGMILSSEEEHAQKIGAVGFLKKPFTADDILSVMRSSIIKKDSSFTDKIKPTEQIIDDSVKSLRILLAEDEKINQLFAKKVLEKYGHLVDTATNGKEAVDMFISVNNDKEKKYDLILMDIQMPVMSGIDATKKIREFEDNKKHTHIIALTAFAMPEDKKMCFDAGMDDFMSKPIVINNLIDKINVLSKKLYPQITVEKNLNKTQQIDYFSSFDHKKFFEYQNGDIDFMNEIIFVFKEVYFTYIEDIKTSIFDNNIAQLKKSAHTLKGSLRTFMATEALKTCEEIESINSLVEMADKHYLLDILNEKMKILVNDLITYINSLKSNAKL